MMKLPQPLYNFLCSAETKVVFILQSIYFACAKDVNMEAEAGSCLVIAPHPDDETLGCGAAIVRARRSGRDVHVVVVTDGSASQSSAIMSPGTLAEHRRDEAKRACEVLGVASQNIVFLNFADGEADKNIDAIALALRQQIEQFAPQSIFSPSDLDKYSDHRAVAAAIDRLVKAGAIVCPVYEYPIWFWRMIAIRQLFQPRFFHRLRRLNTQGCLDLKRKAMAEYRSQCENLTGEAGWLVFRSNFLARFFAPYELYFEKAPSGPL